jgi:hypothetical protein
MTTLPSARSLALVPALITLGVTIIRFVLELSGAPAWLASTAGGGGAAIIGIAWLPIIFGPWFALRLRSGLTGKALWLRLWKTLTVYGLMARLPVWLLTIAAVLGDWGTHYEKFGGNVTGTGPRILAGLVAQLGFWACIWTPAVGLVAALVALAFSPRPQQLAAGTHS